MLQFDASVQVVNLRQSRFQHAQRVHLQETLLRSERSFQLWLSLELMMFSSFAPVVLPQLRARVLSAADCVAVPDVVSCMGTAGAAVVTAAGSSGGVKCTLRIGPIRMVRVRCELSEVFFA